MRVYTRPLLLLATVAALLLPDSVLHFKQALFVSSVAGMVLWSLMGLTEEADDDT